MLAHAGVYTIVNTLSGKRYVGSSKSMRSRFSQHKSALRRGAHQNKHLQAAWFKYGEAAFTFTALLVCAPEMMRYYEQLVIDATSPEYNKSASAYAGVAIGSTCSVEHVLKVKAASKRLWGQEDYRNKVTLAIRSAMDDEEKAKRTVRTAKLWSDPTYRENAINARKGNAYNKGYKCTPEQVLNRRKAARISNMKRNYGVDWVLEYVRRYPEFEGDVRG
jgi:group I intron endonuclease